MANLTRVSNSSGLVIEEPLAATQETEPIISVLPATSTEVGVVKPDNTSITVDAFGTISAVAGPGGVTAVSATAPITSSGGPTPNIAINNATVGTVGAVRPDGTTILITAGVIRAATATTAQLGVVQPDGTTITISGGVISATGFVTAVTGTAPIVSSGGAAPAISITNATTAAFGAVKPDGTTITVSAGIISVPTATAGALGIVKPDGTTITIAAGVITATGFVTAVTGTAPIVSSGGAAPAISITNATIAAFGAVKPDGTTITVSAGVISVPTATAGALGLVRPDATSITIAAGVITAPGPTNQNVVTGSRSYGTVFHNTNPTTLWVSVSTLTPATGTGNYGVFSDSSATPTTKIVEVSAPGVNTGVLAQQIFFAVLAGNFYQVTAAAGSPGIDIWTEWH